jgi:subtilisin-like proprotein convertase family protein
VVLALLSTALVLLDVSPAHADGPTGFTNAAGITIPGSGDGAPGGAKASSYPSNITVSGMTGTTSKVTATLNSFSHSSASDVRMLLVSPTGQNLTLMSNLGGGGSLVDATNANITFDDAAAANLPGSGTISSGSYKPTDDNPGAESFPSPAPVPSAATALTTFNGANPNGTWSLYITDNVSGDTGSLTGGWTITVTTGVVATPGTLEFSSATYSASEGSGNATITVNRTGGSSGAVSAQFNTVAGGTAVAGSQYTTTSTPVNFADGQTSQTVNVPMLDNTTVEGANRTVNLALSAPTGGASLGLSSAVLAISDNDSTANATPITIPATGTGNPTGAAASPYPSDIAVSGRVGTVSDVNVTLTGLTHSFPSDVGVLLVGPAGENIKLMSGTGNGSAASGANLVFDDAAATAITTSDTVVSGTFKPSAEPGGPDPYPAPAPALSGATALSVFNGTNPNGTWSLNIVDMAFGDVGSLSGWSLSITTSMAQSVNEGDAVTVDWSSASSQPSGHALTATLTPTGGPSPLVITSPTATTFKFIAPRTTTAAGDTMTLDLAITDTVTSGVTTVAVSVNVANIVPTAAPTAAATAVTGKPLALVGGSLDPIEPDISPIAGIGRQYAWAQTAGTATAINAGSNFRNRSVTPPAAGIYTFSLTVTDHGGTGAASEAIPVTIEVRDEASGTLSGLVKDPSNAAISAVTVDILTTANGSPVATTTTNASGAWSVGGLSNGTQYFVRFSKVGFGTRWARDGLTLAGVGVRPVLAPSPLIDAVLTPTASLATIDGNAVNSSNVAIGALTVRLFDLNGLVATTITNGAGHYQFAGLTRKAKYTIQLGNGNGTFNIAWATVDGTGAILGSTGSPSLYFSTASGNIVIPNITLFNKTTEARSIQATVTDPGSFAVSGAQVRVYDQNGYVQSATTGGSGIVTITGLRPGASYKVWVWAKCPGCGAADLASEWWNNVAGEQFDQSGKLATLVDLTSANASLPMQLSF